jgi:hypothetical protein
VSYTLSWKRVAVFLSVQCRIVRVSNGRGREKSFLSGLSYIGFRCQMGRACGLYGGGKRGAQGVDGET